MTTPQKPSAIRVVRLRVLLMMARRNLMSKRLRTGLTVFGISIGVGAIYFLVSFGFGLQELVTNQIIGNQSIKTIDVTSPNSKIVRLDDLTVERVRNIGEVTTIGKTYYLPGGFKLSGSESDAIIYGVDAGYEDLTYLKLIHGTLPSKAEVPSPVVLNTSALQSIGITKDYAKTIHQQISVVIPYTSTKGEALKYTHTFTIVGIIDSGSGAEVFIPSTVFRSLNIPNLTQLKVGVKNVSDIPTVRTQIESYGLETTSPVDTIDEINTIFRYFTFMLIGFGGIGMIIAILGMFNTLTISLLERTKEIGLMVALGARSIDMRMLFVFETLLLSFAGAVLGIITAILLGWGVDAIMNMFARSRGVQEAFVLFAHPWWLTLGTLGFMVTVGFIVVYMPARRAEKINPIDALRRE